jgi:cysteine desulfurase
VPLLHGGGQEHGVRSGTENVPAIVAMAKALRLATERRQTAETHMYGLRNRFLNHIKRNPRFAYNGSEQQSDMAPHIVNVSVLGLKPEVVVHALAERDIFISTKSACSSADDKPSRVLLAMGHDVPRAASGLRVSFLPDHSPEDVDRLAEHLIQVVEQLGRYQ